MPTDTAFSVSCFWKIKNRMIGGIIEKTTERIIVSALTVCSVLNTNRRTITVCNVPAYSSESVREMAIMFILMLSSSMQIQSAMLERGDHTNFTNHLSVPHNEVCGKTLGVIGEGHIGLQALTRVINHPALRDLPFFLETPNELPGYAAEIALLRAQRTDD